MSVSNPYEAPLFTAEAVPSNSSSTLPDELIESMRQTRPWVTFLAVIGFVFAGLMLLMGLGILVASVTIGQIGKEPIAAWIGPFYLGLALLYVPPCIYMLRYGGGIKTFLQDGTLESLAVALRHQKSVWRFFGIMTVVMLAVYALGIVGVIVWAAMSVGKGG